MKPSEYNYKFIHIGPNNSEVKVFINEETSTAIVKAFVAFLKGCTFHKATIAGAIEEVLEELKDE